MSMGLDASGADGLADALAFVLVLAADALEFAFAFDVFVFALAGGASPVGGGPTTVSWW